MTLLKLKEENDCKGLIFRCYTSQYLSSYRSIETNKSLRLLKLSSCKGCEHCEWLWDFIGDDIKEGSYDDYIKDCQDGKIYKVKTIWEAGSYEYPDEGYTEIEFVEINKIQGSNL